jgi:Tfp pilus assembly protein PilW
MGMLRLLKNNSGVNLVELMVAVLIGGMASITLAVAYTDGIDYWKTASEKALLYSEGTQALNLLETGVRKASRIRTRSYGGEPNGWMDLDEVVLRNGMVETGYTSFYFYSPDASLKWNNMLGDAGYFGLKLIPSVARQTRPGEDPYVSVIKATFTPVDPIPPRNPTTEGYCAVKIELTLVGDRADTMTFTSVVSKRNK